MSKENYNWWKDPKNKEIIEQLSWWEKPDYQEDIPLPVSIIKSDNSWVVGTNSKTEQLLGESLTASASGRTKEEAIKKFYMMLKFKHEYSEECRMNYQRFVPFRKGDWKHTGGKWFIIFGYHFYFRIGKKMQGGWYVPFTKLNILISSEWKAYRRWKKEFKNK